MCSTGEKSLYIPIQFLVQALGKHICNNILKTHLRAIKYINYKI